MERERKTKREREMERKSAREGERERDSVPKSRIYDYFELSKLSDKNELELGLGRN